MGQDKSNLLKQISKLLILIATKLGNLLINFCSFDLSYPILKKDIFIEHLYIVLLYKCSFLTLFASIYYFIFYFFVVVIFKSLIIHLCLGVLLIHLSIHSFILSFIFIYFIINLIIHLFIYSFNNADLSMMKVTVLYKNSVLF